MITLRDELSARKLAVKAGLALQRSGNFYALIDANTKSSVTGFEPSGKPGATIAQVLEWLKDGGH